MMFANPSGRVSSPRKEGTMNGKNVERVYNMGFGTVYPLYVQKVERKGKTKEELDQVLRWLTGYDQEALEGQIKGESSLREFFDRAPELHPNATKITGLICGVRVEQIEDPLMQRIRWMDKLVDELAKGKAMEKILRA